jgi:hypothetical protein
MLVYTSPRSRISARETLLGQNLLPPSRGGCPQDRQRIDLYREANLVDLVPPIGLFSHSPMGISYRPIGIPYRPMGEQPPRTSNRPTGYLHRPIGLNSSIGSFFNPPRKFE